MNETLFALPPVLNDKDQVVLALAKTIGIITATDAGWRIHLYQQKTCACGQGQYCQWAATEGRRVLENLRKTGLLKRDRHWNYRPVETEGGQQGQHGEVDWKGF